MISANVKVKLTRRGGRPVVYRGRNTVTPAGLTHIRNQLIGTTVPASSPIDNQARIYLGATKLGNMADGYPKWNDAGPRVEWRSAAYTATGAVSGSTLDLYRGDMSQTNPALFSFTPGQLHPPGWDGTLNADDRMEVTWTLMALFQLATLNNAIPGSAISSNALRPSFAGSQRYIAERIAGLGSRAAISSANLQFFVPNHTVMQPPDPSDVDNAGGGGVLVAENAQQTFRATHMGGAACPLISNIALGAVGTDTVQGTYEFPEVTSTAIFDQLRWWILYLPGPFILAAGEILEASARTVGPALPNVPVGFILRNTA